MKDQNGYETLYEDAYEVLYEEGDWFILRTPGQSTYWVDHSPLLSLGEQKALHHAEVKGNLLGHECNHCDAPIPRKILTLFRLLTL